MRRPQRRPWLRMFRYVLIALMALTVLVVGTGVALWRYADSRIQRVDIPSLARPTPSADPGSTVPPSEPPPITGTLNVLVVGSDSRAGLTEEQLVELGTEDHGGNLSDTIMVVQVTPVREHAVIVSFPRDLKVDIPGEGPDKINAAMALGGPDLLVQTVEGYTGLQLDHYVEVNIAGFLRLVDVVGGVPVCLDEPLVDRFAGADIPAGCHVLQGRDASAYVRSRRAEASGDFGRIERQQRFLKAAMGRVTSARTLFDPIRLKRLIDVVADSITTDRDLGLRETYRIARGLRSLAPEDVETRVVPSYWSTPYLHAHVEQAEALFQALRDGTPLPDVGLTEPQDLTAAEVRVLVLNAVGSEGLAARTESYLLARGFTVTGTGNADEFGLERTQLGYAPGREALAEYLASFMPDGVDPEFDELSEQAVPEGVDVILRAGRDLDATTAAP